MATGLKIVSVFFAVVGAALLFLSIREFFNYREMLVALARSGISLPHFLLSNIVFPAAMLAASAGLWLLRPWAWWICAIVEGLEVSKKFYLVLFTSLPLFGTFPVKENISLVIAVSILIFLFTRSVFCAFHGEARLRLRTFGIVALASFAIGGLFMWEATSSAETLRSNTSLQATPETGAPELKRYASERT